MFKTAVLGFILAKNSVAVGIRRLVAPSGGWGQHR